MNITVLTGSIRRNGNSNAMADAFINKALSLGHNVTRFDTAFLNIERCRVCNRCYTDGKPCVFDDDYNAIARSMEASDGIVVASPVYWYTFPACLKAAIDKWYSLCVAEKDLAGKKAALISCCEDDTPAAFEGIRAAFEKSVELLKCQVVGEVLVHGVNAIGDINRTDGLERAEKLAELF